jgi:hypothetical protein
MHLETWAKAPKSCRFSIWIGFHMKGLLPTCCHHIPMYVRMLHCLMIATLSEHVSKDSRSLWLPCTFKIAKA